MSKPQQPDVHRVRARLVVAVSMVALFVVALIRPATGAQTNSPSGGGGGQPADSVPGPSAGAPSNQNGPNTGGDTQAGNRSTPGNGGATGGGAGAPSEAADGSSGAGSVLPVLVLGAILVAVIALVVSSRQRRLERVGAA